MEPEWEAAREPDAAACWRELLRPLAEGLRTDARELSEQAVDFIRSSLPELFGDAESGEENRASTEASIRAFAAMLESGADPETADLPAATIAYAQAGVRRGVAFPALLRSYRLGHQAMTAVMFERLAAAAPDPAALARGQALVSQWTFGFVDTALIAAERAYLDEQERWMRSAAASRVETIQSLLAGRLSDADRASTRLRYRLDREHVAAIAWVEDAEEGSDALSVLEPALAALGAALGAKGTLIHPLGLLAVAGWFASAGFDSGTLDAVGFDREEAPGARVAIGEPAAGIEGFRRSYRQAEEARRVSSLATLPAGTVTRYGDVVLSALASVDLDQAADFVERELGPLAAGDEVSLRLAATLRAFLDEQASRSRAANRLGVHENTVSYRVRQAEELLGRYVTDRPLELRIALELADLVRDGPPATDAGAAG